MVIIRDEECGCARIAISPLFPNLLYTVCRSSNASPLPDNFQPGSSLGNADGQVFLWMSAVKDGTDLNTSRPQLHAQECSSQLLFSWRVNPWLVNYFSLCKNIFSWILCVEDFWKTRKSTKMLVHLWKGSIRMQVENLFSDKFFKQCDRVDKTKKLSLPVILP